MKEYVLVTVDTFSKWLTASALNTITARRIVETPIEDHFLQLLVPERISTDFGRQFTAELFQNICWLLQIHHIRTAPYHQSANGQVERANRFLMNMLATVAKSDRDWCRNLAAVTFAYNTAVHSTTKFSPFFLMQGRQSRFPVDNAWKTTDSDNLPNLDYAVVVGARLQTAWDAVAAHIQLQRSNDKERADQRSAAVTGCPVIVGDLVLVLEQALSPPGRSSATFSLFSLCFTGSQRFQRKERVARFSKFQIKRARSGNDKEETARSENSDFRLTRRQTTTFSNAPLTCSCCPSTAAPR